MTKSLLIGTTNSAKIAHMRAYLRELPLTLLNPGDVQVSLEVCEDGTTPEANARKKAHAYWTASTMPTLTNDAALEIARFSAEHQPGVWVKRIHGQETVTDAEIHAYYQCKLRQIGGQSKGCWQVAIVLQVAPARQFCQSYTLPVMFTAHAQGPPMPGAPLNTLMVDPESGKYYAEMTYAERPEAQIFRNFVRTHLGDIVGNGV